MTNSCKENHNGKSHTCKKNHELHKIFCERHLSRDIIDNEDIKLHVFEVLRRVTSVR